MIYQELYKLRKAELKEMYSDFLARCFEIGMQDEVNGSKDKTGIELYSIFFAPNITTYPNYIARAFKSSYNAGRSIEKDVLQQLLNQSV